MSIPDLEPPSPRSSHGNVEATLFLVLPTLCCTLITLRQSVIDRLSQTTHEPLRLLQILPFLLRVHHLRAHNRCYRANVLSSHHSHGILRVLYPCLDMMAQYLHDFVAPILRTSGELVDIACELERPLHRFGGRRDVSWEDLGRLPHAPIIGSAAQESGHPLDVVALSTEAQALLWCDDNLVDPSLFETVVVDTYEVEVVVGIPDLNVGFVPEEGSFLRADDGVSVFFRHVGGDVDGVGDVVLEEETNSHGWGHHDGRRDDK
jgi:hypothetical protein